MSKKVDSSLKLDIHTDGTCRFTMSTAEFGTEHELEYKNVVDALSALTGSMLMIEKLGIEKTNRIIELEHKSFVGKLN
jgi:hypothetical protein